MNGTGRGHGHVERTHVALGQGVMMPRIGLGLSRVGNEDAAALVGAAIEVGYRSFDTAALYGNEAGVGRGIRSSGLDRGEVFVTTKVWNADQGYDSTLRAFDRSLGALGLDHVDLYLIHWPAPGLGRYADTWRALERLRADGAVRAIGVSNFQPGHVDRLLDSGLSMPAVNQIELHPYLQQREIRRYHEERGIVTECWGPLGRGSGILDDPTVRRLARRHGRSPAQVVLRWHLQLGHVVIPKTVSAARLRENLSVFSFALDEFALDESDMAALAALDRGGRTGPHPDGYSETGADVYARS